MKSDQNLKSFTQNFMKIEKKRQNKIHRVFVFYVDTTGL